MSAWALAWAWDTPELKPGERLVYVLLADLAQDSQRGGDRYWEGVAPIASLLRWSSLERSQWDAAAGSLEAKGAIGVLVGEDGTVAFTVTKPRRKPLGPALAPAAAPR